MSTGPKTPGVPTGPPALRDAAAAVAWLRERMAERATSSAGARSLSGEVSTARLGALRTDSRQVQPGDAFIAWPGQAVDGRRFVADALRAGAAACLVEADGAAAFNLDASQPLATLRGLKATSGAIADAWFGQPSRALHTVAITGTNGKTSSAWWVASALRTLGVRAGVIGTLGVGEPPDVTATGLTTPDPVTLHRALRQLADAGCGACAIEASSIGIDEERLAALHIEVAVFTNFTRDHLDYHGSMDAYWAAKRRLFAWPGLRAAVINVDDAQGAALAAELHTSGLDVWTVSTHAPARVMAKNLRYAASGLVFDVVEAAAAAAAAGGAANPVRATPASAATTAATTTTTATTVASTLVGDYNASNLLGVLATLRALGHPLAAAAQALGGVSPVPGRMQRIAGGEVEVVVDYAHTPDALEKVLAALRPLAVARAGALVCVFGCGGDRDATKRALMGGIAERGAARVVLTSDNPRSEMPSDILAQIRAGMSPAAAQVVLIEDRRAAIEHAVLGAAPGDVVLLAGKGHEDYQEIAGVRRPFSDINEAHAALARREQALAARLAPTPRPASTAGAAA